MQTCFTKEMNVSLKNILPVFCLLIAVFVTEGFSQAVFDVISLDGGAKVQRVQKRDWEKLAVGSQINDNDIIETYFQAKIVLQFGQGNVAILGSNSKALVNIREVKSDTGGAIHDVNLTLFSGGCFVKAISKSHISVYTSTAVGETDNGAFSTVVESKTGETGFQTLGGNVKTRNIAQKEGIRLSSGQTTMIFPGKEPTAPLYITVRHVSVLKHFFGDDYIETELGVAGIKPTEDKGTGQTSLSQAMMAQQYGKNADQGMYKIPFSLNKIYGAILTEREKVTSQFSLYRKPDLYKEGPLMLEENNTLSMAIGSAFPCFTVTGSYSTPQFSAGIRFPLQANYTGQLSLYNFSSTEGIFDLVDHISIGPFGDSTFVKLGCLDHFSLGDGLVVDDFNAKNQYSLFHPLGLQAQLQTGDILGHVFIADLSSFSIGGLQVQYEPAIYHFGAGFYYDASQYQKPSDKSVYRFDTLLVADSLTRVLDSAMNAFIYQVDIGVDLINEYDFYALTSVEFAQKISGLAMDGFVLRVPDVSFNWTGMFLKLGLLLESGRLIQGQFHSFYMSNRARVIMPGGRQDTLFTQNTILSKSKFDGRIECGFGVNWPKGSEIKINFSPTIFNRHPLVTDPSANMSGIDFQLSFTVSDSFYKAIKYGSIYFGQSRTDLYPSYSPMPSWGFLAGLDLITKPLFFNIGLSANMEFYFLDLSTRTVNYNNKVDSGVDNVFEISLGLWRGF